MFQGDLSMMVLLFVSFFIYLFILILRFIELAEPPFDAWCKALHVPKENIKKNKAQFESKN